MHDACPCTKGVCLDTTHPSQLNTTTGTTAVQAWQSGW